MFSGMNLTPRTRPKSSPSSFQIVAMCGNIHCTDVYHVGRRNVCTLMLFCRRDLDRPGPECNRACPGELPWLHATTKPMTQSNTFRVLIGGPPISAYYPANPSAVTGEIPPLANSNGRHIHPDRPTPKHFPQLIKVYCLALAGGSDTHAAHCRKQR